ncbi:MAG TPA: RagB/SusD family nutrient uptake outer membrane protein [Flavitalea sp.]|nr:RagB/SusD family nutrient uptake outer membrane protein [Flavitalea sp.]
MKQILNFLPSAIVALVICSSCNKQLEPKIEDQFSEESFARTEADIKSALTPFYASFTSDWGGIDPGTGVFNFSFGVNYLGYDWMTRIMTDQDLDYWYQPWSTYTWGPSSQLSNDGTSFYNRIRFIARATDLIDKISKAKITDDLKAKYSAEAKGLRAWYMFILYDIYGPLNVKLDPQHLSDTAISPRLSHDEYVAAMENDLTTAINGLPDRYNTDAQNWGRLSKGVARMILFKLYMQEKQWDKAKQIGSDIMGMGYSLMGNYKDVFIQPANNELIYAVPGNTGMVQYWYDMIMPYDAVSVLGVNIQAGWLGDGMAWSFYDKYSSGDKRLETIASEYVNSSGTVTDRSNGLAAAIPMKYVNYTPNHLGFEYVIYRYADVLLGMAEIENEINGPTTTAVDYAKAVTDRAQTTIPSSAIASQAAFRDFILDERGRELYYEFGIRRQDLIRHGKLIPDAKARGINTANDNMVLLPIPQDVINEGKGIITQNPGY